MMQLGKKVSKVLLAGLLVVGFVSVDANAERVSRARKGNTARAFSDVCKSTKPLTDALMKNAYPGHISLSDPRASGFAFVCGKGCPRSFPTNAYYSDGTFAFKLGKYGNWNGNGKPRAYCGAGGAPRCSAKSITNNAKKSGRDGFVYIDFGSKACRKARPGVRNGSPF